MLILHNSFLSDWNIYSNFRELLFKTKKLFRAQNSFRKCLKLTRFTRTLPERVNNKIWECTSEAELHRGLRQLSHQSLKQTELQGRLWGENLQRRLRPHQQPKTDLDQLRHLGRTLSNLWNCWRFSPMKQKHQATNVHSQYCWLLSNSILYVINSHF